MSVTINELPSGTTSVRVDAKTPEVEIRTVKETVEHVGAVRENKVIVSGAANFAPAGPPGPTGPKGDTGEQGPEGYPTAFELRGTGMPNGVVTADPGTYYTDTAGTNGAWRWLKTSGTGNTGWAVLYGDTYPRSITLSAVEFPSSDLFLRRIGNTVYLTGGFRTANPGGVGYLDVLNIPDGFVPDGLAPLTKIVENYNTGAILPVAVQASQFGWLSLSDYQNRLTVSMYVTVNGIWATNEPWPTTLPGVPA